jgi:hypothetical protein
MDRRLAHRLVALAAAYAVALNTLLPVLAAILPPIAVGLPPAAVDGFGLTVLCSAGGAERGGPERGAPARPQPLCPCGAACAMPGCGATALPDADPPGAGPVCLPIGWSGRGPDGRPARTIWPGGSKLARGPPVA